MTEYDDGSGALNAALYYAPTPPPTYAEGVQAGREQKLTGTVLEAALVELGRVAATEVQRAWITFCRENKLFEYIGHLNPEFVEVFEKHLEKEPARLLQRPHNNVTTRRLFDGTTIYAHFPAFELAFQLDPIESVPR